MSKYKKQHYIPRCYLESWCDPNAPKEYSPFVWVFNLDGSSSRKKAPDNIFHETDMYTISRIDGARDLRLEHGLSQLEGCFAKLRESKILKYLPLEADEQIYLCAFTAAMQIRTRASREHHKSQWNPLLKRMEEMNEWIKTSTPEQLNRATALIAPSDSSRESIGYETVKAMSANPLQIMIPSVIEIVTPGLCKMDLAFFITEDDIGFITSDQPCVWFDPESYKMPPLYRSPALYSKTIEITLPISPNCCAYFNWQGYSGYLPVSNTILDEMNRRTRFQADEYFVVRHNTTRPRWFERGEEPEDSWEKTHAVKGA